MLGLTCPGGVPQGLQNAPSSCRPAGHAVLPQHIEYVTQAFQGSSRAWLHSPVRPLVSGFEERKGRRLFNRASSSSFYSHHYPFSSDDGLETGPSTSSQARDGGMFGMLQSCYNFGCNATATVVAWAADVFLASPIAPFNVDRTAVENSIRTALILAGLILLQRAIPVLVNLGCVGLGVYILTHVYNVKVPVPGEGRERARRRPPGGRHSTVADVAGSSGATQRSESGTGSQGSTPAGSVFGAESRASYTSGPGEQQQQHWQGRRRPGASTSNSGSSSNSSSAWRQQRSGYKGAEPSSTGPFRGSKDLVDVYYD
ncbi:hypothetical protein DUNSADRAFT_12151 [Dunaliella salina]|uniref:PRA1 family protein n=1 Tax=Dunaliella salina TaxID=3046 RepID=A0ABQ7GBW3_DUNSA|nr:hypothetical protein DUNSADRAFT_12151 [Dunaliella salina]|eukprot:KAF5832102.1 hypothetical protein DUNSADRAFT_12151 [Dunaliella salina]